jgi:hypothetical protein
MISTWDNLANNPRWRGVVSFIRNWVGPFDSDQGMASDEFDKILRENRLTLPATVREWYLLAANWDQGGLNAWICPQALTISEGAICVLTDTQGVNYWGVRVADLGSEDPPVFVLEATPDEVAFPSFTSFVAGMIVNDVLFGHATEKPVEVDPRSASANLVCLVSARYGDFYADTTLESATVVIFAYPGADPAFGKSRTPEGQGLLEQLRL